MISGKEVKEEHPNQAAFTVVAALVVMRGNEVRLEHPDHVELKFVTFCVCVDTSGQAVIDEHPEKAVFSVVAAL